MKKLTTSVIALSLAMIITCFCIAPTSVAKADETVTLPPTINILLLYDDSYEFFFSHLSVNRELLEKRLQEVGKLAELPYLNKFGIHLNFTIGDYSSYLGDEYALQCPIGNGLRDYQDYFIQPTANDGNSGTLGWIYNGQCTCTPITETGNDCNYPDATPGHHNNVIALREPARLFALQESNNFDLCAVISAQSLCYSWCGDHRYCGGMSYYKGTGFVINGTYSTGSSCSGSVRPYYPSNLLSDVTLFLHEFGHSADLFDTMCTPNQPCIMSGGFDSVVSANDIWCDYCLSRFTVDHLIAGN